MKRSMRIFTPKILFVLIAIFLFQTSVNAEMRRGMWVVRYALLDDSAPQKIIQMSRRLQVSDLYVQVRALGKFFFLEEGEKASYTKSPAFKNFIRLQALARQSHIRIHAWLNAFYIASVKTEGDLSSPLLDESFLLRSSTGSTRPGVQTLKKWGVEGFFTDPLNRYNTAQLQSETRFLVERLHVDGIHLDYFRFPDAHLSFSPKGRAAFILQHYYDPVLLFNSEQNTAALLPEYLGFLQHNLKRVLRLVRSVAGDTELSVAVKPDIQTAGIQYLQNWPQWLKEGDCNYVVLMNYNPDSVRFKENLQKVISAGLADNVFVGVSTYNQTDKGVVERLTLSKKLKFPGTVLFSYNDLLEKGALQNRISILTEKGSFQ